MDPRSWFRETITVASVASVGLRGVPVLGPQRQVKARVERVSRFLRTTTKQEVVSSHKVYTATEILPTDRVWLPGANTTDANAARIPAALTSTPDRSGAFTLYEVDL